MSQPPPPLPLDIEDRKRIFVIRAFLVSAREQKLSVGELLYRHVYPTAVRVLSAVSNFFFGSAPIRKYAKVSVYANKR